VKVSLVYLPTALTEGTKQSERPSVSVMGKTRRKE